MLHIDYFYLISPTPIYLQNVGHIKSPTLKEINELGINNYNYYLSPFIITKEEGFKFNGLKPQSEKISEKQEEKLTIFDLLIYTQDGIKLLQQALNFFILESFEFDINYNCFISKNIDGKIIGFINKNNFTDVKNCILQLNNRKDNYIYDKSEIKNEKALEIFNKINKAKEKSKKNVTVNKDLALGNIISVVANKHPSINILNIWELTIYQLWDTFNRLSNNNIYDISALSVAVWGDEKKQFNISDWFKRIDNN